MLEVFGFLLALLGLGLFALVIYWITVAGPARRAANEAKKLKQIEASESHKVVSNHQELFLLVNDLLSLHRLGYQVIFPDEEMLQRAQELTANYRNEVTQ